MYKKGKRKTKELNIPLFNCSNFKMRREKKKKKIKKNPERQNSNFV